MKKIALGILLLTGFLVLGCHHPKDENQIVKAIENQLDSLLAETEIEALSVGIIDGETDYTFHKGKLLTQKAPSDATLYEIASLTKTFTGTLLAQAVQEGKIQMDDDIRIYVDENLPNLAYNGQPITFRHLVTHQSGLPHMFPDQKDLFHNPDWDKLPFRINELQKHFSRTDFFDALARVALDTIPGVNFIYSNAGANLSGYLLESIYDQSFEDLLQAKILEPLQMTKTAISRSNINLDQLAFGQNTNNIKMPFRAEKAMNAEGGIISTVVDMLKYVRFHLDENNPVIARSHQHLWNGKYGDFEAGFFWQINKNGGEPDQIFQNGGAFGTSSWVTLIPEQKLGVFMVTNVSGPNVHQKLSACADQLIKLLSGVD